MRRAFAVMLVLSLVPAAVADARSTKRKPKPKRPDLVLTFVGSPPASAARGTSFASSVIVRNRGKATAAASTARFYLSRDARVGRGDLRLADTAVRRLRATRQAMKRVRLTIPAFAHEATYRLIACANRPLKLKESSQRNNCRVARRAVRVRRGTIGPGGGATSPAGSLAISPAQHAFGAAVGRSHGPVTFTVTNTGQTSSGTLASALSGADASMFAITEDTCVGKALAKGATCTLKVTFTPTSLGAKTASLQVAGSSPGSTVAAALAGTGQTAAALGISPASDAFPETGVGATSPTTTFTVTNNGQGVSGALAATLTGLDASQFKITQDNCAGATLAGGANCTVLVAFAPTGTGGKTAQLQVVADPGGTVTADLTGTGLTPAALTVDPPNRDYGTIPVGGSSAFTFTVSNTGQAPSGTVTVTVEGPDAAQFVITANSCTGTTVPGSATCEVQVTFMPSGSATPPGRSASLRVSASPGTPAGSPASASLIGQAAPATLSISGPPAGHGATTVGGIIDQTYTVTNSGVAPTGALVVAITPAGSDFAVVDADPAGPNNCTNYNLPASSSCTLNVRFAPTAQGLRSATLQVSGTSTAASIALSGTGLPPGQAQLTLTPSSRDYGTIPSGQQSDFTFTVQNTGQSNTGTISQTVSGAGFSLVSETCTSLLPSQTCTITVRFASTGSAGTVRNGTLSVSASPGGSDNSPLTGTVGPAP